MKKIVLLIICMILLSGCTTNYDIEINNGIIKENITVTIDEVINVCADNEECDNDSSEIMNYNYYPFINNDYIEYDIENIHRENLNKSIRTYEFTYKNYKDSYVLNECTENFEYKYEKGYIYINASDFTKCYNDEKIIVSIKTKNFVFKNNADQKNNNVYTWNINENNYKTKNIMIKVSVFPLKTYFYYLLGALVLVFIITLSVRKSQKVNAIS